ncbi:MAG: single-stranded DNA-binding protein [Candidatus Marinamargulisbacteria bacterium]
MNDLNEVYLVGRAVDDVKKFDINNQLKYTFVIAVNYFSSKKKTQFTDFIPVAFWTSAESIHPVNKIQKGDTVIVNGRISIRSYEKEGKKSTVFELVATYLNVFKFNRDTVHLNDILTLLKENAEILDRVTDVASPELKEKLRHQLSVDNDTGTIDNDT